MTVTILESTHHPEEVVWRAARTCYSAEPPTQLTSATRDTKAKLIRKVIRSGHLSCLEHVSFTFAIEGISRACSHQLVRHRLASFSQQSQRYVETDKLDVVVPPSIKADPSLYSAEEVFWDCMMQVETAYELLIDRGIPAEDARYVLPNAARTNLVMTMNARELLHFFKLRCCQRAQWEIRKMAEIMLTLCQSIAPVLFEDAGAPCESGECREVSPCKEES